MKIQMVNASGLNQIRDFLSENHKYGGDHFSSSMLKAYAEEAEFQLSEGNAPFIELRAAETVSGHTEQFTISEEGLDSIILEDEELDDEGPYYVVEVKYVGPNPDQNVDANRIEICNTPELRNGSGQPCLEGWCGTTNDWSRYGHGQYSTVKAAKAAIAEKFGECRETDQEGYSWLDEYTDDYIVEILKPGKLTPMSSQETADWAAESIREDVDADTTDEEIKMLVVEYEDSAKSEGYKLDSDLESFLLKERQDKRDALEEWS